MDIQLNSNDLKYFPVYPSAHGGPTLSTYQPKIKPSLSNKIYFDGKELNLESTLICSIIKHVFEDPFKDGDCLEFVARILNYKNTKFHHRGLISQDILKLQSNNQYIGNHSEGKDTPHKGNHIVINLGESLTKLYYSPIVLGKLGDNGPIVFSNTFELDKVYGHELLKWHFDDSNNFENYITKKAKSKAGRI